MDEVQVPLVVRVISDSVRREIEEFSCSFVERFLTSLFYAGWRLEWKPPESEELGLRGIIQTYAEHSWYVINLTKKCSYEEMMKLRETIEVKDFPSYVLKKLLEFEDEEKSKRE